MPLPRFFYVQERVETAVRAALERQRLTLIVAVTLLGAALALVSMYIDVPVTLREEVWRYVVERPPVDSFFKYAGAAVVGGGAVAALLSWLATEVGGPQPGPFKMAFIAFFYGVLMPYVTGFMVPVNMFFVRIMNLSEVTTDRTLSGELIDLAFGTPRFTFFHGMLGMYQGLMAGLALFVLGSLVLVRLTPSVHSSRALALRPVLLSLSLSLAIATLVMFGPFGVFRFLVDWFART